MVSSQPKSFFPLALRLPPRSFVGAALAILAMVAAIYGRYGPGVGLSRPAEVTLGIMVAAAALWISEAVPLFVTSLVVLSLEIIFLAPLLGGDHAVFLNAFFSDVSLLFLGGFVLSAGIERVGLAERVAGVLVRVAGSSPSRVLLALMLATSVLGVWMSNTAACALMLGLATSVLARVPEGDGFRKALLVGIAFSANLGGLATPVSSPPNAIVMRYLSSLGAAPSFVDWIVIALPLLLLSQGLLLVFLVRWFPSQLERIEFAPPPQPFGRAQLLVLAVFALTVVGWVIGARVGLSPGTVALLPVVAFFATDLLRTPDLRALPWDVILLIGGGLALGSAVQQSGLAQWIAAQLPLHGLSPFFALGAVAAFAAALSSMMSNTATITLLAPIVVGLEGVNTTAALLVAAFACTLSMPLPVSTPPNAMAYGLRGGDGRTGLMTARDMIVPGVLMTALGLFLLALLTQYWLPRFVAV